MSTENVDDFKDLNQIADILSLCPFDYWIAGGWAVDLHIGKKTREHKDIEIAINRKDQKSLLKLPNIDKVESIKEKSSNIWSGEFLNLPIHELYCHFSSGKKLEVLLNEFDNTHWLYRRNLKITLSKDFFTKGELQPLPLEIVLLYKSKNPRQIDEQDFRTSLPFLEHAQKDWLKDALMIENKLHPWLADLY